MTSREAFEKLCDKYGWQLNYPTANVAEISWQAATAHILAKLESPEMVEKVVLAIGLSAGNPYADGYAKAAIATIKQEIA